MYYSWGTRTRRLGTALRRSRRPDQSGVLADRLRAEQTDVLARWAADLTRRERAWLSTRR